MSVLRPACPICRDSEKLLRCQGCMVMLYCCWEHQAADRINHKVACNAVKKSRNILERKERELRAAPPSFMLPANVFEAGAGDFYEIFETRDYMRARNSLIHKIVKINTYDAVKVAFEHVLDALRLCRLDHLGLRLMGLALFIRFGKDQECYDLMKWYANTGMSGDYDWRNMDSPFLDVKDADAFEPVDTFGQYIPLEFAVALMLIKKKLLNDLRTLQSSLILYDILPLLPELVNRIRKEAIMSNIVSKRKDIFNRNNQIPFITILDRQIMHLFKFVEEGYKYFWPALLDPTESLALTPARYSYSSEKHTQMCVQYYYDAYVETPGSIHMIRKMVENKGRS